MDFLLLVVMVTAKQLAVVFGFFIVAGFVLSQLQKFTQRQYYQSVGWLGILWTAWIGTPVHELSHWILAKLFGHHIESVSLFRPNKASGKLGEVVHGYNPRNIYHQIGNFFIGAAPLLGGVLVLVALFIWVLPNSQSLVSTINTISLHEPKLILKQGWILLQQLFSSENIHSYRFWIFIYLSFAVSSHLAPSSFDQKSMFKGLVWFTLLLIIINSGLVYFNLGNWWQHYSWSLPWLVTAFWYAISVSLLHALISFIIFLPFRHR